jgi:hypothetical protein
MFKKNFYLFCFLALTNCSAPGTALLGPIFTGAKTGSVYQASLSYSTSKIIKEVKNTEIFSKPEPILLDEPANQKIPVVLISYAVDGIEVSNVIEPEPLP